MIPSSAADTVNPIRTWLFFVVLIAIAAGATVWAVVQQDRSAHDDVDHQQQERAEEPFRATAIDIRPGYVCGFAELPTVCSARLRASLAED